MLLNGLLCVGLFLALLSLVGLLLLAVASARSNRLEREALATGRPMLTALVMANSALYEADGPDSLPGVVVFAFFEPTPQLAATLKVVAERCYECYEHAEPDQLAPPFRALALRMKDHRFREWRRTLVPPEVSDGLQAYVADLWIYRDRLLDGWPEHRIMPCAVTGQADGQIVHLPLESPGARQIYMSAGPETAQIFARAVPADGVYAAGQLSSADTSGTKARELRFYLVVGAILLLMASGCGGCLFSRMLAGDGDNNRVAPEPVAARPNDARPNDDPPDQPPVEQSGRPNRIGRNSARPSNFPRVNRPPISTRPTFTPPSFTPPKVEPPKVEPPKVEPPKVDPPTPTPPTFEAPVVVPVVPFPTPSRPSPARSEPSAPRANPRKLTELPANLRATDELRMAVTDDSDVVLGPAGCPVAILGREVWDLSTGMRRSELPDKPTMNGLRALSANGEWLAVASKSMNQTDTSVAVYKTSTGERVLDIAGQPDAYVDLLAFTRDKYLLTGGRHSNAIDIWDVSTGDRRTTIQSPARSIRPDRTSVSPDGQWFTAMLSDSVVLAPTKSGGSRVPLETPAPKIGSDESLNAIQLRIRRQQMATASETFRFSPDSQELAAIIDSRPLRLVCWNLAGKLLMDAEIPEAREAYFFRRSLTWFPDKSGWVIAGHVFDRETRRIVISIPARLSDPLTMQPLDRRRVLGILPSDPQSLRVYEIDWPMP